MAHAPTANRQVKAVLDGDGFGLLLHETDDVFHLAIRGHAAIETLIGAAIGDTFPQGKAPKEILSLRFETRVSLAVALGVLPKQVKQPLLRLAELRNQFAHGDITALSQRRAASLFDAVIPALATPFEDARKPTDPVLILRLCLTAIFAWVETGREAAAKNRAEQETLVLEALQARALRAAIEQLKSERSAHKAVLPDE